MDLYKNKFRIESVRLSAWDYSNPWWYFVTINTKHHIEYFGTIVKGKIILSDLGQLTDELWTKIPEHYPFVELDYCLVMPNHIHGIIIINEENVKTGHAPSLQKHNLGNIIGSFKSAVTNIAHKTNNLDFSWQPRYYDRIIRNEKELFRIRKYITDNPLHWEIEKEHPKNILSDIIA